MWCFCLSVQLHGQVSHQQTRIAPKYLYSPNGESTRWLTLVFLRLCLSLQSVAWSLPAVVKLVIYSKQPYNPVANLSQSPSQRLVARGASIKRAPKWCYLDFFLPFFPTDGCEAGLVWLNVNALEELHGCGHLDHVRGLSCARSRTRCSLTLWQAAMLGWQLNNTKLLSVSGQAWLNPRYTICTHTHTHSLSKTITHTWTHTLWKSAISIFFSL